MVGWNDTKKLIWKWSTLIKCKDLEYLVVSKLTLLQSNLKFGGRLTKTEFLQGKTGLTFKTCCSLEVLKKAVLLTWMAPGYWISSQSSAMEAILLSLQEGLYIISRQGANPVWHHTHTALVDIWGRGTVFLIQLAVNMIQYPISDGKWMNRFDASSLQIFTRNFHGRLSRSRPRRERAGGNECKCVIILQLSIQVV